jgi:separase
LLNKDIVVYCGHGAGERFIARDVVERLPRCAAVLLMGCSSGRMHLHGEFEPTGMCASFLAAGCPALVANLWDVTDKDIDALTLALLEMMAKSPGLSFLDALAASRSVCKFSGLNGAAPVCYGLPLSTSLDSPSLFDHGT